MKRISIITFPLLFVCVIANAQISWGPKIGISTEDLDEETLNINSLSLAIKDANYGFHAGLFFRVKISDRVFLQPEVLFNTNSVDFKVTDLPSGLSDRILKEKYQHLDIPLMLGLKYGPLRLQAGPTGHVYIASSSELDEIEGYERRFNDFNLGFQGGLGLDIWKIIIDVKYEGNLSKFGDHMTIAGQDIKFSQRPSRWLFSIGFSF
jgi:hypothetical protein